ncbi:hypothetical protein [Sphingobacterium multivorum]|uniref:hypothetical protein n=1 Tax=Sphingobacterium multivorum TaxID=28454 RepID=UPI0028A7DCA9|nr:hypothetical protein [Sphingobacterium multivorum]
MNVLFIGAQEILPLVPLVYGVFILAIFYGLYKVLSILQNRSITAKREHTVALFQQSEALKEIALIESKLKAGKEEQKKIRNEIRTLGFYGTDFGMRPGYGYMVDDFKNVITILR